MKSTFMICSLTLLVLLAGCQNHNRYSMHGTEIIQYQGDDEILKNCCSAAMALLAEDIRREKGLDLYPLLNEKSKGWTWEKKGLTYGTSKRTGWRMTLTCNDDDDPYRIEVARVNNRPAIVIIDGPDDDALVNHLKKLFSNFDVKLVNSL